MEGAEKYDIITLMCDKKVFLTHKDMEELLAVETKIQRVWRLRGEAGDWVRYTWHALCVGFSRYATHANMSEFLLRFSGSVNRHVEERRHRYQTACTFCEMVSNEWPQADCIWGHQSKSESCTFIVKVLTNQGNAFYESLTTLGRVTQPWQRNLIYCNVLPHGGRNFFFNLLGIFQL